MNTFSNNASNDNYKQLNIKPKIDCEPLDGFDARLNHRQFKITDQVLKDMSYALGNASENYFKDQDIKAVKEFAKGNANTLVIPSDVMNDIGKLPIDAKIVEASISKKTDKKATSKSNKTEN